MSSAPYAHPAAMVDGEIGEGTRVWAFAHVCDGAVVGANCNIGEHCFVEGGARIGDAVTVKNGVAVWNGVELARGVFVGPSVVFTNDRAPRSPRLAEAAGRYDDDSWLARTVVGEGATLGAGAVIVAGIELGAFSFVAAGAVVTRSVLPHQLVVGTPARPMGWVCCCGERLHGLGDGIECSFCHRRYRTTADSATLLD